VYSGAYSGKSPESEFDEETPSRATEKGRPAGEGQRNLGGGYIRVSGSIFENFRALDVFLLRQ
jgi:hypothetical protein